MIKFNRRELFAGFAALFILKYPKKKKLRIFYPTKAIGLSKEEPNKLPFYGLSSIGFAIGSLKKISEGRFYDKEQVMYYGTPKIWRTK